MKTAMRHPKEEQNRGETAVDVSKFIGAILLILAMGYGYYKLSSPVSSSPLASKQAQAVEKNRWTTDVSPASGESETDGGMTAPKWARKTRLVALPIAPSFLAGQKDEAAAASSSELAVDEGETEDNDKSRELPEAENERPGPNSGQAVAETEEPQAPAAEETATSDNITAE